MILQLIHPFVIGLYAVAPLAALGLAVRRSRRIKQSAPLVVFWLTVLMGLVLAGLLLSLNMAVSGLPITYTDSAGLSRWDFGLRPRYAWLFLYFVLSALFLAKAADRCLVRLVFLALRVRTDALGRPVRGCRWRGLGGLLFQRIVLLAVLTPYMIATLVVYRPKFDHSRDRPDLPRENARFQASDGTELCGWWMAAPETAKLGQARQTVLICPGLCSSKEQQSPLLKPLLAAGFNVFVFDFRGQGDSDGHATTFGDVERRDVLAAVTWIKNHHREQSERLVGIGTNTGAAALVAAAADPDGQSLDAIVLIEPYGQLSSLAGDLSHRALPRPVAWLVDHVGIPLAEVHTGANLADFAPAKLVDRLWPRPVLIVHGNGQSFVPFHQPMEVYQFAMQPKGQFWPSADYERARPRGGILGVIPTMVRQMMGTGQSILSDQGTQGHIIRFLQTATPVPVL